MMRYEPGLDENISESSLGTEGLMFFANGTAKIIKDLGLSLINANHDLKAKESYIQMLQTQLRNAKIAYEEFSIIKDEYTAPETNGGKL